MIFTSRVFEPGQPCTEFADDILLADHMCYPDPDDQVDAPRLRYICTLFPQGFRLWYQQSGTDLSIIGYTGWYPVAAPVFDMLAQSPGLLTHRGEIMPCRGDQGRYIYIFNYSIMPEWYHSIASQRMLQALSADLALYNPSGLAAITVSDHGARVARRFGMYPVGSFGNNSDADIVYLTRQPVFTAGLQA